MDNIYIYLLYCIGKVTQNSSYILHSNRPDTLEGLYLFWQTIDSEVPTYGRLCFRFYEYNLHKRTYIPFNLLQKLSTTKFHVSNNYAIVNFDMFAAHQYHVIKINPSYIHMIEWRQCNRLTLDTNQFSATTSNATKVKLHVYMSRQLEDCANRLILPAALTQCVLGKIHSTFATITLHMIWLLYTRFDIIYRFCMRFVCMFIPIIRISVNMQHTSANDEVNEISLFDIILELSTWSKLTFNMEFKAVCALAAVDCRIYIFSLWSSRLV